MDRRAPAPRLRPAPGPQALLIASLGLIAASCAPEELDDDLYPNRDEVGFVHHAVKCPNGGNVEPPTPAFDAPVDAYAEYDGQDTCDPTAKPGVKAFRDLVLKVYPCTTSGGIVRDCSVGGTSEHKEGRAWDWMLTAPHPAADAFLGWLLAPDAQGHPHAMARRLGIMYMIWDNKMWRAYRPGDGWQPYTGTNPHTDHVHFSFSWAGARKQTSFWTDSPCPATGTAKACLDDKLLGDCTDGYAAQAGDCSEYAAFCTEVGGPPRCASALCVDDPANPQFLPPHEVCLPDGQIAHCTADGSLDNIRSCPEGTSCTAQGDSASCRAPGPGADQGPGLPGDAGASGPAADAGAPLPGGDGAPGAPGMALTGGGCAVGRGAPAAPGSWLVLGLLGIGLGCRPLGRQWRRRHKP